jgi:hypothetical protein
LACPSPELKQKLYRFVRGELEDASEREAVRAHTMECEECAAIQRELHWLLGTMRRPGGDDYDQDLQRELGARAGAPERAPLQPQPEPEPAAPRRAGWLRRLRSWLSTGSRRAG